MKRFFCFVLIAALCLTAVIPASLAENNIAVYEELLKGTWNVVWRYLPSSSMALKKLSDPTPSCTPVRWPNPA